MGGFFSAVQKKHLPVTNFNSAKKINYIHISLKIKLSI